MIAAYPEADEAAFDPAAEAEIEAIIEIIRVDPQRAGAV